MLMTIGSILLVGLVFIIIMYRNAIKMWEKGNLKVNFFKKLSFRLYLIVNSVYRPKKEVTDAIKFMLLNVYDSMSARMIDLKKINAALQEFANNIHIEAVLESKRDRYFLIRREYSNHSKKVILKFSDLKAFEYSGESRDELTKEYGSDTKDGSTGSKGSRKALKAGIRLIK